MRLGSTSIANNVGKAAERAGLPWFGPHVLCHTGCMLALEGGASIPQVVVHARHRSVVATMVYVHQRDRLGESAVDLIRL